MKRTLMALALLGCMAGLAHADYLILRVNLGIPPLPPKQLPNMQGPGGFQMGQGIGGMIPQGGLYQPMPPRQPMGQPGNKPLPKKTDPKKNTPDNSTPLTIVVFLEYDKAKNYGKDVQKDITYTRIRQKWGYTFLAFDQHIIHLTALRKKASVAETYKQMREAAYRPASRAPRKFLDLAEWALVHNVLDEKRNPDFLNVMDDLVKMDAKAPIAEPDIHAALQAYQKVKTALEKPIEKDDALAWKEKLRLGRISRSDHYALLYDSDDGKASAQVASRLNRLEQNYQQFFYWFALRGKVLPAPPKKLLAVLVDSPLEFHKQHEAFDSVPTVTDGFHARRENIVFFSSHRLDEVSDAFDKHLTELVQNGWDFKSLLKGMYRKGKTGPEVAYAQTMALVHKCLQEESEIASVTHEGTRQLLTATGVLPRGIALPEWLQFGLPSVFETPKYDPFTRTGAFYPMFGGPSWTYLVHFKLLEMEKRLEQPPERALLNVLTDAQFRQALHSRNPMTLLHARTMAWSLSYYLTQRNLDGLRRYCQELANLPRDLDFDDDVYLGCFARAFDLEDAKQPGQIDMAKMRRLAADWYQFIGQTTPLPMKETLEEARKAIQEYREKTGGKGPGAG